MTRLIRSRWISGRGNETRRCAPDRAIAVAVAASFGMLSVAGERTAWAQQPAQCRPTQITSTSGPVLTGLNGAAIFDVQACAPGDVLVGQGNVPAIRRPSDIDPSTAYYGGVTIKPCELPSGSDLPEAKLAISFVSENPAARATKTMTLGPDTEKPTLKTTSTPGKGTRVKAHDTIKVRMEANEEYTEARFGWQTGVKKIQLTDESRNQVVPPHFENSGPPQPCQQKHWKQTLEITYTVPPNPPPIIRLRAIAEDFAGNKDDDLGQFPTQGDWYGRFEWKHDCRGGMDVTHGDADLTLDDVGGGNLTGTLTGRTPQRNQTMPACTMTYIAPGTFSAKLKGSYTPGPETFFVEASEGQTTPGRASFSCTYANTVNDLHFYTAYEAPIFREAFRDLRRQPDGSWKLIPDGKHTQSAGGSTCTTTYSLTLNRTRN